MSPSIILEACIQVFTPLNLVFVVLGVMFGMVCGALPGLSSSMAIVLMLPFTYTMTPVSAIVMLVAVYVGGACGGSISAILLKTPGTPEAVATTFDGYPMAQKGKAGRALGVAVSASSVGGIFSAVAMLVCAPLLAVLALKFQSAEYFALGLLGLSCITSIGAKNQTKALFSVCVGLLLATVGIDAINGAYRFTFDQVFLLNGIDYIPVMIGSFALTEVYKNAAEYKNRDTTTVADSSKISLETLKLKELAKMWAVLLKSSVIGTIIGIIPAAGGSIASLVSYGVAAKSSKHPEEFGKGCDEGIAAPESANNAAIGGSLVPTMVLGIPGSPTAAIIMAAFMIHNLTPGPLLIRNQPVLLNAIFLGIVLASLLLFVVGRFITKQFAQILKLPYPLLGTVIAALGTVGAYSLHNSFYDVLIMYAFSFVGLLFNKFHYSNPAMILGLILGSIVENNLRKQLILSGGTVTSFFTRPLALVIIVVAIIAFASPLLQGLKEKKTGKAGA